MSRSHHPLAQKARAPAFIYPGDATASVRCHTGLIKANFPARISFQVTREWIRAPSSIASAQRLLSAAICCTAAGTAHVQRLHGAFVSEAEIRKVTDFAKQKLATIRHGSARERRRRSHGRR